MTSLFGRDSGSLAALSVGRCIAQVMLVATWAVFAPGNIVVRLPWPRLLGMMMRYVLAVGQQCRYHVGTSHPCRTA